MDSENFFGNISNAIMQSFIKYEKTISLLVVPQENMLLERAPRVLSSTIRDITIRKVANSMKNSGN